MPRWEANGVFYYFIGNSISSVIEGEQFSEILP